MNVPYRLLLTFLLGLAVTPLPAVEVEDLYSAEVPVTDRSDAARSEATRAALGVVLVRTTGERSAPRAPEAQPVLARADAFAQAFEYRQPAAGDSSPWLRVRFDPTALEAAMREAGLVVWGSERPVLMVWLAVREQGHARFIGAEDRGPLAAAVRRQARYRGVPVLLPMLDLEDTAALAGEVSDEALVRAAQRYAPQAVLTGRLEALPGGLWSGQWRLDIDGTVARWQSTADRPELAIDEGIDAAVDALAARYVRAAAAGFARDLDLEVRGLAGVGDLMRVESYLADLGPVTAVSLQLVAGDRARFAVRVQGDAHALRRTVALGQVLLPEADDLLAYRVVPR